MKTQFPLVRWAIDCGTLAGTRRFAKGSQKRSKVCYPCAFKAEKLQLILTSGYKSISMLCFLQQQLQLLVCCHGCRKHPSQRVKNVRMCSKQNEAFGVIAGRFAAFFGTER